MKRSNGFLMQRVNFFISVIFIASFGLFMVTMVLKAAKLENPIFAAVGAQQAVAH